MCMGGGVSSHSELRKPKVMLSYPEALKGWRYKF